MNIIIDFYLPDYPPIGCNYSKKVRYTYEKILYKSGHEKYYPLHSNSSKLSMSSCIEQASLFSQERVTFIKEEHIGLIHQANCWKAQYGQLKQKLAVSEEEIQYKDAEDNSWEARGMVLLPRTYLPVITQTHNLAEDDKKSACYGSPACSTLLLMKVMNSLR